MESRKKYTIGTDLGGTNTVFGIVDFDGNIVCEDSIKTQDYPQAEAFVETGSKCIMALADKVGGIELIAGMGIGAPNANYYTGCIEQAPNLPWKGTVPLADLFNKRLGIPVKLTNDANAAAMGEMKYGAAKGMNDFVEITLGTGVGSGIVANGQLIYGHDGFAGELGHVIIDRSENARLCGCGRKGCLEAYCSAPGIVRTAKEYLKNEATPSDLRSIPLEDITAYAISKAAHAGDALAIKVFEHTAELLGKACADFAAFSSPEAFVFFGGPMKSADLLMPTIIETYNDEVLPVFRGKAKFIVSSLMDRNSAVLGAAALV